MNIPLENSTVSAPISPIKMLVVVSCTVFIAEFSIMVILGMLPPMPQWIGNMLDAFALTALLFPALYFLIFQPMTQLIEKHRQAEAELLEIRDLLEHIAAIREQELESAKKAS
jgi:hypothetical protein